MIRIGQVALVLAAAALWGASRITWVEVTSFDGLHGEMSARTVREASGRIRGLRPDAVFNPVPLRRVVAAAVENKSGRQAIEGTLFVDATGDGDLCARAGARFAQAATDDEHIMAMSLMYRVMGIPAPSEDERRLYINGLTTFWGSRVGHVDGTSYADLTRAEILARRELAEQVDALKRAHGPQVTLVDSATTIGVRETRHILGDHVLSEHDFETCRKPDDGVVCSAWPMEIHEQGRKTTWKHLPDGEYYKIPYRSLLVRDFSNLLVAGRNFSATHLAQASARVAAICCGMGEAAGTAAAMALATGNDARAIDVQALLADLERHGAILDPMAG